LRSIARDDRHRATKVLSEQAHNSRLSRLHAFDSKNPSGASVGALSHHIRRESNDHVVSKWTKYGAAVQGKVAWSSGGPATPYGNGSVRYYDAGGKTLGTSTTTGNTTRFFDAGGRSPGSAWLAGIPKKVVEP
jgi:hypothetical protein